MEIQIKKLSHAEGIATPYYATTQSAGMDISAAVDTSITIMPFERLLVPTGIIIAIPQGYEGQIRPRSGLALRYGITILNAPGTIDSDYRGEIKICLINLSQQPYKIKRGDRIAQLIITAIHRIVWNTWIDDLLINKTSRNEGGFGSSGR
ncbi:dUTP diphosphatase [Wolbachia endosymbiont of Howardula sp.]|uniref:dUTP diphosphatase n=1 Tax=Wolbachia endosymbiont of Howardula sp. TaxID=2916816 RepID=UPI00217D204C|nr:dUTP diphosphatase [Wolbachia endosymbiont of Howardula sp.]UWI83240.1 dUTP diphosphatase [Wolbachia endosymbiont of Howardula sp.]